MEKIDIKSMTLPELTSAFQEDDLPSFRAGQVYRWLHRGVSDFNAMSDLNLPLRKNLQEKYEIYTARIEKKLVSVYDSTVKYLFSLSDTDFVESVVMKYNHGYSQCLSTQIGCKMGCAFCATGKDGFVGNLTASQMLSQIQSAQQDLNVRISHLVLMGMGEPLDNYDNVLRFLELADIGQRHISLSTCGLADKIYDLAEKKLQITLSVSLHAPNDEIRSKLMPVNKRWGIAELINSCKFYTKHTGRRISFEYAMIASVNDSDACAFELAALLRGMLCHLNLIPVNSIEEENFSQPSKERLNQFLHILKSKGINTTIRRTLGADISASCGQLKRGVKN